MPWPRRAAALKSFVQHREDTPAIRHVEVEERSTWFMFDPQITDLWSGRDLPCTDPS
jgi:hypothetical protein